MVLEFSFPCRNIREPGSREVLGTVRGQIVRGLGMVPTELLWLWVLML